MSRAIRVVLVTAFSATLWCHGLSAQPADKAWIDKSNAYTNQLLDHRSSSTTRSAARTRAWPSSTSGSRSPTLADELAQRRELEAVLAKVDAAAAPRRPTSGFGRTSISCNKAFDLQFRREDFELAARGSVPTTPAS